MYRNTLLYDYDALLSLIYIHDLKVIFPLITFLYNLFLCKHKFNYRILIELYVLYQNYLNLCSLRNYNPYVHHQNSQI